MLRTVIESPYAGNVARNVRYALACMKDSLTRGEAPFASHLLYTQVLQDADPDQRRQGMEAGFSWGAGADQVAAYVDLGWSQGMIAGRDRAADNGLPVFERKIGMGWDTARPVVDQPPPVVTDSAAVWPAVITLIRERLDSAGVPVIGALLADMAARDALGRERYGTPLQVDNGRDAEIDAYQEVLDLVAYRGQVMLRRPDDPKARRIFWRAVDLAIECRADLG